MNSFKKKSKHLPGGGSLFVWKLGRLSQPLRLCATSHPSFCSNFVQNVWGQRTPWDLPPGSYVGQQWATCDLQLPSKISYPHSHNCCQIFQIYWVQKWQQQKMKPRKFKYLEQYLSKFNSAKHINYIMCTKLHQSRFHALNEWSCCFCIMYNLEPFYSTKTKSLSQLHTKWLAGSQQGPIKKSGIL